MMREVSRGYGRWLPATVILGMFLWAGNPAWGQNVFINEIHYDNRGADADERLEVAGPAGTDMNGWSLVLYNGKNGMPYRTIPLEGAIPDQQMGYGTVSFPTHRIENGAPDGIALVNPEKEVVQFVSYEGGFTAASDRPRALRPRTSAFASPIRRRRAIRSSSRGRAIPWPTSPGTDRAKPPPAW